MKMYYLFQNKNKNNSKKIFTHTKLLYKYKNHGMNYNF